LTGIGSQRSG